MNWKENKENHYHECSTPIGKYEIVENYGEFVIYLLDKEISREKDLETAKEEARTHINTLFYKLKIYLDI